MKKVLIIDDDLMLLDAVKIMLESAGYTVLEAANGYDGVQIAQRQFPDIIVCDIMMEQGDGYYVLAEMQKRPATASIPFVFLTGKTSRVNVRRGMELGASDYLTKPFTEKELLSTIEAQMRRHNHLMQLTDHKLSVLKENISLAIPHEMRTQLTSIIGLSKVINRRSDSIKPTELSKMAQSIFIAGKRLYRTIENFLLYTQLELISSDQDNIDSIRQEKTTFSKDNVTEIALEMTEHANRSNDLILHVSDGQPHIHCDYLKKIVEELIDNSLKFSQPGTRIVVNVDIENDMYILSVKDSGVGMLKDEIKQIGAYMQFERRTHEQQGIGLGLTIVKQLADVHGGSMRVDSKRGKGTIITIYLPARVTE